MRKNHRSQTNIRNAFDSYPTCSREILHYFGPFFRVPIWCFAAAGLALMFADGNFKFVAKVLQPRCCASDI